MAPNDILLYSQISAFYHCQQRNFLKKKYRDPVPDIAHRVRVFGTLSPNLDVSNKFLSLELRKIHKTGD